MPRPPWLDEGLGDEFSSARRNPPGSVELAGLLPDGMRLTRQILEEGLALPLAELLELDQGDDYEPGWARYAQGWSLVHFSLHHDDPRVAGLIPAYLREFRRPKAVAPRSSRTPASVG